MGARGRDWRPSGALGLAVAFVAGTLLEALDATAAPAALQVLLFQVESVDPPTYGAVALFLAAVAFAATWVPALRATRVDPQRALSSE